MHRVELKASVVLAEAFAWHVPNVPCGVESCSRHIKFYARLQVPNVPCGVERTFHLTLT